MAEAFAQRMEYMMCVIRNERLMKKVEAALYKFKSTLGDELHHDKIRKREDKSAVWSWVEELEDLTYKTEDALDKCWRVINSDEFVSQRRFQLLALCCINRWASAKLEALNGLKGIVAATEFQVETLLSKGMKFLLEPKLKRPKSFPDEDDRRLVSSVREDDKGRLLEHLFSSNRRAEVKVISIVGFGGSGKTTLARSLYNHHRVVAYFQVRVWVHVSDIFDERMIATKLLDSLRIDYAKEYSKLESLLHLLQDFFSKKTVLVVFDDVWTEEASKWEPLKKSLGNSSILVTTRSERAAKAVCSNGILHNLAPLSVEECLLILKRYTGQDGERVHDTALEKCEGSPLVARMLQSKHTAANDEVYMEEVCMVRFRQFYHTYDTLPPYMKSCLLLTAFFPKGAVIDAPKLILLWMSQGYLGYPVLKDDNTIMLFGWEKRDRAYGNVENKGSECLTRLIGHLFFEKIESQSIHKPHPISYKMPDAAHDFVTYMAHLHGGHGKGRIYFTTPGKTVTPDLFGQLKRMTALILSSSQLDELPEEVRLLTRLQYLDLSDNPLKRLPPTVCELYHLEFLDVHFCYLLSCLPQKIGKLGQMKHLRINHTTEELHDLPSGFRDLTFMRTLDVFRVGGKYKDAVNKLRCLNHLVDLCLSVHGEAIFRYALKDKNFMKNLELLFVGEGRNQEMASSVEDLIPPPSLQMLKFEHYPGFTLPSWILAKSFIGKLTRLSIRSAVNINSLPALWKLSSLEFLWLYDIPKLKHLGCEFFGLTNTPQQHKAPGAGTQHSKDDGEITVDAPGNRLEPERAQDARFPSLITLRIEYLENWEAWEDANEGIKVMPCLKELVIAYCPKIEGKPLCILKDTPWFKSSNTTEEAKNVKQPSRKECSSPPADDQNKGANVVLKALYMKLKKFVCDAYMTKSSAQPLKVSIPEGVLGKTMVTSYLQLDSLFDWFEKDRSIFAEQMCVWSKHIYELMTPSDKERVQMASSALIKTVGRQEHSGMRAEDLVDFMMENKAKLFLVPFLRPGHWELLAIVPESEVVYWFDPLQGNISLELTKFLNMVERKYTFARNLNSATAHNSWKVARKHVTRNLNFATAHNSWKVVDIKHKRQVDNWECGYYVMIWMHKIALEIQDLNIESHFPTDASSYEAEKLREVDWKWCAHVMPEIEPMQMEFDQCSFRKRRSLKSMALGF